MKSPLRIIIITYIIVALLIASCKKEELDEAIIGSWDLITEVTADYQNDALQYSLTRIYPQGSAVFIFDEDDTLKVYNEDIVDATLFLWRTAGRFLFLTMLNGLNDETKLKCSINEDVMTWIDCYEYSSVSGIVFKNVSTSTFYRKY